MKAKIKRKQAGRVTCNKCNSYITIKVKETNLKSNAAVKVSYFECQKCQAKYLVKIVDSKLQALISEVRNRRYDTQLKNEVKQYETGLKRIYSNELVEMGIVNL